MTHEKIKAIPDWPYTENPKDMCSFVGLPRDYRKLVTDFSKISAPQTELFTADQKEFDAGKADGARWTKVK